MALKVQASAPSNIALIKYMGKSSVAANLPANSSLSYTLDNLRTFVEIEEVGFGSELTWQPLFGFSEISLSAKGQEKFLNHAKRLMDIWGVVGSYTIRSANNFPADCGLASSASSFAALTKAVYELATLKGIKPIEDKDLAKLSRLGSGSSCRSFFGPWCLWQSEDVMPLDLPLTLYHAVVLVEEAKKEVSSSEAHRRVQTSLLYDGRERRAEQRLDRLLINLREPAKWPEAFELVWNEFYDMHSLFETSQPSFGYLNEQSHAVLSRMRAIWRESGDGPLVTMDAGPNVHVLFRRDQREASEQWFRGLRVIKD